MIQADTGERFGAHFERGIAGLGRDCFLFSSRLHAQEYTPGKAKTGGLGSRLTFCAGGFKTRV